MQIVWLNHRDILHPAAGGAERTVFEIGRRLVARGHSVTLLTGSFPGCLRTSNLAGIDVRRVGQNLLLHAALPVILKGRVRRPDVIIEDLAHVVPWWASNFSRAPVVAFFHHLHSRTLDGQVSPTAARILSRLESAYPKFFSDNIVITESETAAGDLVGLGFRRDSVRTVPPGVDTSEFKPSKKSDSELIVYFGGFRRYKRPTHAIRAFERILPQRGSAHLQIAGSGPELSRVIETAQPLVSAGRVDFMGRLDYNALPGFLAAAHVNLHCAVAEGWCFSAMEAAACGVPTVAYRVPGLSESVQDSRTGVLVEDGSPDALAAGIVTALENLDSMSRAAREWALAHSWDAAARAWERILLDVT